MKCIKHQVRHQVSSNNNAATSKMNVSISYRFFMEFFRFTKTGFDLVGVMNDIIGDEIEIRKSLILINLIINQKKFDAKLINENASTFTGLLGLMTGLIEAHLETYQEKFIIVMEHAELAVSMGITTEQQYLSTCNTFKMLSDEATNLKRILAITSPFSFSVENENTIRINLKLIKN